MNDQEINAKIDEIQAQTDGLSAEARNALHACRPGHPLGRGRHRGELFANAAFMIARKAHGDHLIWLRKRAA